MDDIDRLRTCESRPSDCLAGLAAMRSAQIHYDSAFTQKTFVHASEEDLQPDQAALARSHKIA